MQVMGVGVTQMCLTEEVLMVHKQSGSKILISTDSLTDRYTRKIPLSSKPTLVKTLTRTKTQPSSLLQVNTTGRSDISLKSYPLCHVNKLAPVWQSQPLWPLQPKHAPPSIPSESGPHMVEWAPSALCRAGEEHSTVTPETLWTWPHILKKITSDIPR